MHPCRYVVFLLTALAAILLGPIRITAHDGDHGSTRNYMETITQKLRAIDGTLSKTAPVIAQLTDSQSADGAAPSGRMAASMRSLLEELRRLQNVTDDVADQPGIHERDRAMAALDKASRDLERMSSALQSMAKNVSQMSAEAQRISQR